MNVYYRNDHGTLWQGDCLQVMDWLRIEYGEGWANTVVTSPPYFGLRDYGVEGQIGLEETPDAYVEKMVQVFRSAREVLRDDGTLWLNLGDSYAGSWGNAGGHNRGNGTQRSITSGSVVKDQAVRNGNFVPPAKYGFPELGIKPKDLIGIPWRVAFALQSDGWYLRQDIIWHKPNPMPESVRDRCTKAHEYVFLFSKSPKYYFDSDAVKEPVAASTISRLAQPTLVQQRGSNRVPGKTNGVMEAASGSETRNRRSVWSVTTKPFKGAHFAVFPPDLIEPCVLAGCPQGGVVLDPFMGSGTTSLVAENLGRRWVGLELNTGYCEIIAKRLEARRGEGCLVFQTRESTRSSEK